MSNPFSLEACELAGEFGGLVWCDGVRTRERDGEKSTSIEEGK